MFIGGFQARLDALPREEISLRSIGEFLDIDRDGYVSGKDCLVLVRDVWSTIGDVLSGVSVSLSLRSVVEPPTPRF